MKHHTHTISKRFDDKTTHKASTRNFLTQDKLDWGQIDTRGEYIQPQVLMKAIKFILSIWTLETERDHGLCFTQL